MDNMVEFNTELLKELMAKNNIKVTKLARKTGFSRVTVWRYLNGKRKQPEISFLHALCELFKGYTVDDFILSKV